MLLRNENFGHAATLGEDIEALKEALLDVGVENDEALPISLQAQIHIHLETLQNFFERYFCSSDLKIKTLVCDHSLAGIVNGIDLVKDDLIT
jgi:hypothetical protein